MKWNLLLRSAAVGLLLALTVSCENAALSPPVPGAGTQDRAAAPSATTWYLLSGGGTPSGLSLSPAKGSLTGFQPTAAVTGTPLVWYTGALAENLGPGTAQVTLWTTSPGTSTIVEADLLETTASGGSPVILGSAQQDVNATGLGNHPTVFTFATGSATFSNQLLAVRVVLVSGGSATAIFNSNDFSSTLVVTAAATPLTSPSPSPTPAITPAPSPLPTVTVAPSGSSANWYLLNTGTAPTSLNLTSVKGSQTGFQPTQALTAAQTVWYSAPLNENLGAGSAQVTLWTTSPGTAAVVKTELLETSASGASVTVLGSAQADVNATGLGNHPTVFNLTFGPATFSNQLLAVRVTLVSGGSPTAIFNSNDFSSTLGVTATITPTNPPTPTPTATATPKPTASPVPTPTPKPTPSPTATPVPTPVTNPALGPNVLVFTPAMSVSSIQTQLDSIYNQQVANQFGPQRYALLFAPGTYPGLHINVGFFTQVAGLGLSPDSVVFNNGSTVQVSGDWFQSAGTGCCTCNFWRSAENFRLSNPSAFNFMWAVSQACPLRRVDVDNNLYLFEVGPNGAGEFASGGFLADSRVGGSINPGSQQQFFTRNTSMGSWASGVWNMVFVGDTGAPTAGWSTSAYLDPYTTVATAPAVREKPFLYVDGTGAYHVFVPALRTNASGPSWTSGTAPGTSLDLGTFYIAQSATDTAETINAQLAQGKNLLLTPGVYSLDQPISVTRADTIVLGLGIATLQPTNGTAALTVADVSGVMVAGILFDAGTVNSPELLLVGPTGSSASHGSDPTTLSDLFFRVGGGVAGQTSAAVIVNSSNVIGDDLWAWRADHGVGNAFTPSTVGWTVNPSANGLVVNGDNVTMYALAVEHFQQYQTLWNGNGGQTYFYQSELPYDPQAQSQWMSIWGGTTYNGWAAYKVADPVTSHQAFGLGVYAVFIDTNGATVNLDHAVEVPTGAPGVKFTDLMDLSIQGTGNISHLIDSTGAATTVGNFTSYPYLVTYP